jgi:hypothetical protein
VWASRSVGARTPKVVRRPPMARLLPPHLKCLLPSRLLPNPPPQNNAM